jgi:hypothetical protein
MFINEAAAMTSVHGATKGRTYCNWRAVGQTLCKGGEDYDTDNT